VTSTGSRNALGAILFSALLIGGATSAGLLTDTLVEGAVFAVLLLMAARPLRLDRSVVAALVFFSFVVLVQFLPVPSGLIGWMRPLSRAVQGVVDGPFPGWQFVSMDIGRSLTSAIFFFAALGYFVALGRLSERDLRSILPFAMAGTACNLLAAVIQYSAASVVTISGVLPYTMHAGFFANENHFSALVYMMIPFIVMVGLERKRYFGLMIMVALILIVQFAVGSRAGVILALAVTALSILIVTGRDSKEIVTGLLLVAISAALFFHYDDDFFLPDENPDFGRLVFAKTTLDGIFHSAAIGYGFGTFEYAYQAFEEAGDVFREYVNHAHDDYLEVIFDGGICALVAILCYFVMLIGRVRRAWETAIGRAALLAIGVVLIHSLVDYPLRTIGLSLLFAYLNALVFRIKDHASSTGGAKPAALISYGAQNELIPPAISTSEDGFSLICYLALHAN